MQPKFTFLLGALFLAATSNFSATTASAQLNPEVSVAPKITTQPASITVALSHVATFTVAASGTAPLTYQWYKNGQLISGATASKYTTPAATNADYGAYFFVIVTNSVSSVQSNYAYLTVGDPPVIASQPTSISVTTPGFAFFNVSAFGTGSLAYQWYKKGVVIAGATGSSYATGEIAAADNGDTFYVVVKNTYGSAKSQTATLTVKSSPAGALPIVGYWSGTVTSTSGGNTPKTSNVTVALSQTSYSLIGTVVFIDGNGTPHYNLQVAALNGQNIYAVRLVPGYRGPGLSSVTGGFSTNLLTLNFLAGTQGQYPNSNPAGSDELATGILTLSSDLQTLTGTASNSFDSATMKLTREK